MVSSEWSKQVGNEFQINKYLSLRSQNERTDIYVDGEYFRSCTYLILNIEGDHIRDYDDIKSIDEVMELYGNESEQDNRLLDPQTEFWGHCSNLHAWAEHDYDTRILDMRLAFPLLKKLTEAGDPKARRVFKEEIGKRMSGEFPSVKEYLKREGYLDYFTDEEMEAFVDDWVEYKGERIPVIDDKLSLKSLGIKDLSEVKGLFQLKALENLDLSDNKLNKLPKAIDKVKKLKEIDLRNNNFTTIPKAIIRLPSLRVLSVKNNQLKEIPDQIGNLVSLKKLSLEGNKLKNIPEALHNLTVLKSFGLGDNEITDLPEFIGNFPSLKNLNLSVNHLKKIPRTIGNLTSLETLWLDENQLKEIPKSIGNLKSLKTLDLTSNQLLNLPETMGNMISLKRIFLSNNKLTTIPKSLKNLKSLKKLNLSNNNLKTIPASLAKINSLKLTEIDVMGNRSLKLPKAIKTLIHRCMRERESFFEERGNR